MYRIAGFTTFLNIRGAAIEPAGQGRPPFLRLHRETIIDIVVGLHAHRHTFVRVR
jgi:hypothetical protein